MRDNEHMKKSEWELGTGGCVGNKDVDIVLKYRLREAYRCLPRAEVQVRSNSLCISISISLPKLTSVFASAES